VIHYGIFIDKVKGCQTHEKGVGQNQQDHEQLKAIIEDYLPTKGSDQIDPIGHVLFKPFELALSILVGFIKARDGFHGSFGRPPWQGKGSSRLADAYLGGTYSCYVIFIDEMDIPTEIHIIITTSLTVITQEISRSRCVVAINVLLVAESKQLRCSGRRRRRIVMIFEFDLLHGRPSLVEAAGPI